MVDKTNCPNPLTLPPEATTREAMKGGTAGNVQGEGDYESARRYDEDVKQYVAMADIERAAHEAAPNDAAEAAELQAAEEAGKARAK